MSRPLRWKLIAGFLLVFVAGLVLGVLLGADQMRKHRLDYAHHGVLAEKLRNRMQSRLDLTPEQVKQTAPIFDATARQLEQIRIETTQHVHAAFEEADRKLAPQLTAEQRLKMENLEAKHDSSDPDKKAP